MSHFEIVIAGAGTTGQFLVEVLLKQNVNITIIDTDEEKIQYFKEHFDVLSIQGDCLSHYILRSSNVTTCDIFIATTRSDSVNILSCQLAKRIGAKYCVSKLISDEIFPEDILELQFHLGIDWLISPNKLSASKLIYWIQSDTYREIENYFSGRLNAAQIQPLRGSHWYKKPLKKIKIPPKTKIIAYSTREGLIKNNPNHILLPGEKTIVCSSREGTLKIISENRNKNQKHYNHRHNIYIAGVNRVIISMISATTELHHRMTIFEKSREVCQKLQAKFRGTIIHCDFTEIENLRNQNIETCKTFICGSKDDAENLISALNAQELKIPNIISVLSHTDKYFIFKRMNIEVIMPNELVAIELSRYFNLNLKEDSEFIPGTNIRAINKLIDHNSSLINQDPNKIFHDISPDIEVIAIWRNSSILLSSNEKKIEIKEKDRILVISLEGNSKALKKIITL